MPPRFASVGNWTALSGIGRTTTYRLLAEGKLRAVKIGARTLIDVEAAMEWLNAQPAAAFRPGRPRKAA